MQRGGMVTVGDAHLPHAALEMTTFCPTAKTSCRDSSTSQTPSAGTTSPGCGDLRRSARRYSDGEYVKRVDRKPARAAEYAAVGEARHFARHYLEVLGCRRRPPDPDFEIAHGSASLLSLGLRRLAACRVLLVGGIDLLLHLRLGVLRLLRILRGGGTACRRGDAGLGETTAREREHGSQQWPRI